MSFSLFYRRQEIGIRDAVLREHMKAGESQTHKSVDAGKKGMAHVERNDGVAIEMIDPRSWDQIATQFSDATYEQTYAFGDHRWGRDNLSHVVVRRDNKIIGACQLAVLRLPLLGGGLAYGKFGPLWRPRDTDTMAQNLRVTLSAIRDEYAKRQGMMVSLLPPPEPGYSATVLEALHDTGFLSRRKLKDPNRFIVNLKLAPDQQHKSLNQKWRYNLRKALTHGLEFSVVERAAGLQAFYELHSAMQSRKGFKEPVAVSVIAALQKLPLEARPKIIMGYQGNEPIVGAAVGRIGDTAQYLYGASSNRALGLKAGYALQWWITNWLHRSGVGFYDLGGEAGEPGLRQFKKGLVGKAGIVEPLAGEFDFWSGTKAGWSGDLIYALRDARNYAIYKRSKWMVP